MIGNVRMTGGLNCFGRRQKVARMADAGALRGQGIFGRKQSRQRISHGDAV
jgi:hypothetical protein